LIVAYIFGATLYITLVHNTQSCSEYRQFQISSERLIYSQRLGTSSALDALYKYTTTTTCVGSVAQ